MLSKSYIEEKSSKLAKVKKNLKAKFIGLDEIIDRVIDSIQVWFITPELLLNPVIINLWGMTGVGKTDLVRKLVKELNFEDKFVEIQLNNDQKEKSIQEELIQSNILYEEQAILLLDEIQRFRSIDEEGKAKSNSNYSDIWELLSDGSFSNSHKECSHLQMFLIDLLFDKDYEESEKKEASNNTTPNSLNKNAKKRRYKNGTWSATKFKILTGSKLPIEEIMTLDISKQIDIVQERIRFLKSKKETKKFKKLLIFICGNLDEAYLMARDTTNVNIDADIINEKSKEINILNIKKELLSRFTPEQIARLGNNHIIYPSLSKQNFKDLINYRLNTIKDKFYEISKVKINFNESINQLIYNNGVFPTQGVRPLFSTINLTIENTLPNFLFNCLSNNVTEIEISGDSLNSSIICKPTNKDISWTQKVLFEIDSLKKKQSKDLLSITSIHEVGHALIYMLLFKVVPKQICNLTTDNSFVIPHDFINSKENILSHIKVLLAGKISEEIIFGEDQSTNSCSHDYESATSFATELVRSSNMGTFVGSIINPYANLSSRQLTNIEDTNNEIEQILKESKEEARNLLKNNIPLLKLLTKELLKKNNLHSEEIFAIVKDKISGIKSLSPEPGVYSEKLTKFLEEENQNF